MPLRLSPSLVGAVLCGALLLSGCDSHTPDPVSSLPTFQEGTVYQYRYSTTTRPLEDPDQAPRSQASTVTVRVARTGVSLDSLDGLPPRLAQTLVEVQSSKASAPDEVETQWYVSSGADAWEDCTSTRFWARRGGRPSRLSRETP